MRIAKYRQDMDLVQDAIIEAGSEGLYMVQIMNKTHLTYNAVQQATARLRKLERINYENRGGILHFTTT